MPLYPITHEDKKAISAEEPVLRVLIRLNEALVDADAEDLKWARAYAEDLFERHELLRLAKLSVADAEVVTQKAHDFLTLATMRLAG